MVETSAGTEGVIETGTGLVGSEVELVLEEWLVEDEDVSGDTGTVIKGSSASNIEGVNKVWGESKEYAEKDTHLQQIL